MAPLLLVLLLALVLFGAGFSLEAQWWIAVVVLLLRVLGFMVRTATGSGSRARW
ncbi:hydrophobic protein [Streptomyces sp. NBC_00443]|uniref:hydrophobic protein n=1 Tax=Streptomyces sp. NBC_00443 TaxID=2975743 RepID=UPI002E22BCF4